MQEELIVELAERSYPIAFFHNADKAFCDRLEKDVFKHSKIFLLIDKSIPAEVLKGIRLLAPDECIHVFEQNGEPLKSMESMVRILDWLAEHKGDRNAAVVAIGGGVVGDLVGFAAASYLRGVPFYQIPTTLLAMVDSSVGGKTGVNIAAGKNLVGAFYQPQAVYIGTQFLKTLPAREFAAGMAEVIKYGMLADAELYRRLEEGETLTPDSDDLPGIIRRCCEIKADVVAADEKEQASSGGRALLNLGHTFGHAIERVAGYGEYLHGEAVAIGLVLASRLSERLGKVDSQIEASLVPLLERYQLPTQLRSPLPLEGLMDAMRSDKKVRSGKLRFVTMSALGDAVTEDGVDEAIVQSLWKEAGAEI